MTFLRRQFSFEGLEGGASQDQFGQRTMKPRDRNRGRGPPMTESMGTYGKEIWRIFEPPEIFR